MLRKYPIIKWTIITVLSLVLILVSFGYWFYNLLPIEEMKKDLSGTTVSDLPYLSENEIAHRGKILAVVTSTDIMGSSGKETGYELTELARAYYVFEANGFEVDIASPLGGDPPVIIDKDDTREYDYAFLNDTTARYKRSHTIPINNVEAKDYEAIYFVGGKGAMFDFPDNKSIKEIVKNYYQSGKVIGAVCHGPAALVNVTLDNGHYLVENKKVSSFTNQEELLLISEAKSIFPFLLQSKLTAQKAKFIEGDLYLDQVSHDDNLVTGQNPWSTWTVAETMIKQLGYNPKERIPTAEENAVKILAAYNSHGFKKSQELIKRMLLEEQKPIDRFIIASHSIMAVMNGEIGRSIGILRLASFTKSMYEERVNKS